MQIQAAHDVVYSGDTHLLYESLRSLNMLSKEGRMEGYEPCGLRLLQHADHPGGISNKNRGRL